MTVLKWLSLVISLAALGISLFNLLKVAKQRNEALETSYMWSKRYFDMRTERDAALHDMHQLQGAICSYCANLYRPDGADHVHCKEFGDLSRFGNDDAECSPLICGKFAWRGVCAENTKEENA